MTEGFVVDISVDGEATVVAVAGEVDLATAPLLGAVLEPLVSPIVVVDLALASVFGAAGIRVVEDAAGARARAGGRVVVRRARPLTTRVFEICGLDGLLSAER